ncbi:uncharacterized protein ISCGN_007443 [Ixodes scapularis]
MFARPLPKLGIPLACYLGDNGSQFISTEFKAFSERYQFCHVTSSPRYPQSNGEAERTVQTVKRLLEKSADPYLALLAYRSTPGPLGKSPSELLMGRRLRSTLPVHPKKLTPCTRGLASLRRKDEAFRDKQRRDYDHRNAARPPSRLLPGDQVCVKDCRARATVLRPASRPRSYMVQTETGAELERNRRGLVVYKEPAHETNGSITSGSLYEFPQDSGKGENGESENEANLTAFRAQF